MTLLLISLLWMLHLNEAKKINVEATLYRKDVFDLFSEDEIWGIKFQNKTEDTVQVNVVSDESKLMQLKNKDIILTFDIIYDDVESVIQRERYRLKNRTIWNPSMRPDIFFLEYRDWFEYEVFIEYILLTYPDLTSKSYIGSTIQGREIPIITLSSGNADGTTKNLYIQAAAHAREWLANMATMYILNELCQGYGNDETITNVLDTMDIFIVPTQNIDGYIYSYNVERLWRKNRRNNGDGSFGIDLNRNYDGPPNTWCTLGASTNPSSNTYCGTSAYSEPETRASRDFITDPSNNIGAAVDMHTFGELILWPYGSPDPVPPPFYQQFVDVGNEIQQAIASVHGVQYESMQAVNLYPTSGTMRDFSFASIEAYGFTWEGRGAGFDPPPTNIIPAGQEQLQGHLALAKYMMRNS